MKQIFKTKDYSVPKQELGNKYTFEFVFDLLQFFVLFREFRGSIIGDI